MFSDHNKSFSCQFEIKLESDSRTISIDRSLAGSCEHDRENLNSNLLPSLFFQKHLTGLLMKMISVRR